MGPTCAHPARARSLLRPSVPQLTSQIWNGRVAGDKLPTRWKLYYVGVDWNFHKMTGGDFFTRR